MQAPWHLEFTHRHGEAAGRAPTQDHLLVLHRPDRAAWEAAIARLERHGATALPSCNPWWDREDRTYEDPDGNRIVLQNAAWTC